MTWADGDLLSPTNLNTKGIGPVFNVRSYGAVGDGATDDTLSITSAIKAAYANGGGTIFFPATADDYICASTLSLRPGLVYQGEVVGAGTGYRPVRLKKLTGSQALWAIESASSSPSSYSQRVQMRDLSFHGSDTVGDALTDMRYASLCMFERCFWSHASGPLLRLRATQDVNFNDCEFEFGGSNASKLAAVSLASDPAPQFNCNEIRFNDCRWETNDYSNLEIAGTSASVAFDIYLTTCKLESQHKIVSALSAQRATNLIVADTIFAVSTASNSGISTLVQLTTCAHPTFINTKLEVTSSASLFCGLTMTGGSDLVLNRFLGEGQISNALVQATGGGTIWVAGPVAVVDGNVTATSIFSGTDNSQVYYSGTSSPRFIGTLSVGDGVGAEVMAIDGGVGTRDLRWLTNGSRRWQARTDGTAESGSNAGSDFQLSPCNDSGNLLSAALTIIRASGQVQMLSGTQSAPPFAYTSEASLGMYRSTASTIAQSYGTFNLTNAHLSVRTTNTSLNSTNVGLGELAFFVDSTSGFSIGVRSGATIYYVGSSSSTKG